MSDNFENYSMKVQARVDMPSNKDIDAQIRKLEKSISKLKVSGQFDDTALKNLNNQLDNLKASIATATFSPTALSDLTNQVNKALQNINIGNISVGNVGNQAKQVGQQIGQQFQNGINSTIQKGNLQKDFFFSADKKNDVAKRAQEYFRGISNGVVTVTEQMENLDGKSELRGFIVNIKNAKGEIESLKYSLRNILDDNGNVTGQKFAYISGSINDANAIKQFKELNKIVTDYEIKLSNLKTKYSNANVDYSGFEKVLEDFKKGIGTVDDLRLALNQLENSAKLGVQSLKSQSSSFDPIQQALNNMRDMPSMLKTLEANMSSVKDKTSLAGISVEDLTDKYDKLHSEMAQNGGKVPLTEKWTSDYRELMSIVTSVTKQVDALKKAEASDNSQTQKQANYYSTLLSNYRKIYSLKKKLITAGEEESKVINEQIRSLNASNASISNQLGKQGLKDSDWESQVNDLKEELDYSLRISEARQKDKVTQSNLNDAQRESIQIVEELEQAYQRVQDIKVKIASLDKEKDGEKISTLSQEEKTAQDKYNQLYNKLRKRKNYDKDSWNETKSAIDAATKSQIEYNNAASQDTLNKVQKAEIANFRILKDKWDKQGILVDEFKEKVEAMESSLTSVDSKGGLDNLKIDIKDLKQEASQLLEANKAYEKAEKELTATLEKRRVAQANSAKEKAKSNAQQELAQQREVNAILSKQESAYKEIWNINKQIANLDTTEDADVIGALNEKKKFYQDIYMSAQKELQAYNNIVVSQEHLTSLAEIRKKAESEIGVTVAKQNKALADEANEIQHSLSVGDYDTQLKAYSTALQKAGIEGTELTNTLQGASEALSKLKTSATGDNIIPSEVIERADNLTNELEKLANVVKNVKLDNSLVADDIKVNDSITRLNEQLRKNSAYATSAKDKIREWIRELENGDIAESRLRAINSEAKQLHSQMAQLGKIGKSRWQTFTEGIKTFTEWGTASGAVMEVVNVIRHGVTELKELDDILTEISKTSDLTITQLEKLGLSSYDTASKYGRGASDYLSGVQSMSQSGFYGEQGEAMAEQSLLAQAAGDMSQEIADKYIIATNAAYKFNGEASKLNDVLDGQNSVANQNSVALEDMATAMSEAGTVASSYNVAVEDFSAMVGTIEAVTKAGGNEVGNSIKSILINLQNVTSGKITNTLDKANASMTEFVNGTEQLRNPIDILRDLAFTFNSLEDSDPLRAEILTNVAGRLCQII